MPDYKTYDLVIVGTGTAGVRSNLTSEKQIPYHLSKSKDAVR